VLTATPALAATTRIVGFLRGSLAAPIASRCDHIVGVRSLTAGLRRPWNQGQEPRHENPVALTIAAAALALAASVHVIAQTRPGGRQTSNGGWVGRTQWGDPDLQGEWTSEGSTACRSNARRSSGRARS
jgi:hypothetical protein